MALHRRPNAARSGWYTRAKNMDLKHKLAKKAIETLSGEEVKEKDLPSDAPAKEPSLDDKTSHPTEEVPGGAQNGENEPSTSAAKPKKGKKRLFLGIGIGLLVLLVAVCFIMGGGNHDSSKIDLMKYLTPTLEDNVNGYGKLSVSLDEESLRHDLLSYANNDAEKAAQAAKAICENTTIVLSKSENIANGDKVDVTVVFDGSSSELLAGLPIQGGTALWEAADMADGQLIYPFADNVINLRIEGNSGTASAYLDVLTTSAYSYYLNYDWEPKTGLKNGDVVVVSILPMLNKLMELGYTLPSARTCEFIVTGLNTLVTDYATIPDAYLNSMVANAEGELHAAFNDIAEDAKDVIVSEPEITSIYFLDKADKSAPYSDWFSGLQMYNAVVVLGHFDVQDTETHENNGTSETEVVKTYGGYYVWIYPDMAKKPGGDYEYNADMIVSKATSYATEEECVTWMKNEFSGFAFHKIGSNSTT